MKRKITAVIIVALILAAFALLPAPRARADISEAQVLSYSWYVAPLNAVLPEYSGDLIAVGEVQNVGSNVLGSVFVTGLAYNSTGGILDSNGAHVVAHDILPGQKAPFYIDFIPENSVTQDQSWVPYVSNVTCEVTYVNDTTATPYTGLTIPTGGSSSSVDSSGTFTVTGTVQNTGTATVDNVWVDTTFYNASGTVVGLNFTSYFSSLAPGGSVPFTATPTDNTVQLSSEITNYSLLIQYASLTTSSSPTPSPSPSATPTSSPVVSMQPTQSPAPMPLGLIYTVGGAIVVVVVVLAALLLLRKRNKNAQFEPLPPPPPPPPPPPA